jgi:hypothetical protein
MRARLLLAFLATYVILQVQGQEIAPRCDFDHQLLSYRCNLTIHNRAGRDDFTEIAGDHLSSMRDRDVTVLVAHEQNSKNIPSIICEQFENLRDLTFTGSRVDILTTRTFAGCQHLRNVVIFSNQLRELPENLFGFNRNLRFVNVEKNLLTKIDARSFGSSLATIDNFAASFNQIVGIDEQFFSEATRLMAFWTEGNDCVSQNFFIWSSNREQVRVQLRRCFEVFENGEFLIELLSLC